MINNKNIKKIILLITTIILFFSFNIEVNAKKDEDKTGTCTYEASKKGSLTIRIKSDKDGNLTYHYKSGNNWPEIKGKKTIVVNKKDSIDSLASKISCPFISVYEPKKARTRDADGQVMDVAVEEYSSYDHVVHVCKIIGSGYDRSDCRAGIPLGYFDKQNNTDSNKKYQEGECTYSKDGLELKIIQDAKGKIDYKYKDGSNWKSTSENKNIEIKKKLDKAFTKCPNVSIIKNTSGKYQVSFNPDSCVVASNYICASVSSKSGNFSKKDKDYYELENLKEYDPNTGLLIKCPEGDKNCNNNKCKDILGNDIVKKIKEIVNIVRIMVPILLIAFGTLDFGKAIFSNDENEMKKAQSRFVKRLIIAIGFFIIPSIIGLLLKIAAQVWNLQDPSFCGILD